MRYLIPLLTLTATCTSLSAKSKRWEQCNVQGEEGHCMPPAECKAWNGVPVAGDLCKQSPNGWQCCTAELPPLDPSMADDDDDDDDDSNNNNLTKRAPGACNARGVPGVCIKKSACKGTATPGAGTPNDPWTCPKDPNDVMCCTDKAPPGPPAGKGCNARGVPGVCMKKSACRGTATPGAGTPNDPWTCPNDPNDVMCCTDKKPPPPPAGPPVKIPEYKCKRHVIDAGYKILNANPGKVRSVGCYGKRSGKSEHPLGLALDLMTGAHSPNGQPLAEWVMHHAGELKVKYVIWGQKIWESGERVRAWAQWEKMEDRGGVTANHW
ncbi:hypothetical protein EMCG_02306 [[Emmonsia] crescens]|uniref:ARB-07466-like C-terminal domain-containing protein n=1 Tax=[Emmonsia] crescens TaxID=73230 RepID=A0A0G2J1Q2_9EURO|nr:hypothetical protein EMCG_02306 [Emmonsia crescens UAMH 3008]